MEYKDYYKILGVKRDAGQDEIKRVYRRLARKYHPDVSKEADAEARFKEVGEAYEVLKDPEKRAAYDRFGQRWKEGQEFRPPPGWDAGFEFSRNGFAGGGGFSDFFEALFGRGGAASRSGWQAAEDLRAKGEDHYAKVEIDLGDTYSGTTRDITLHVPRIDAQGSVVTRPHTLKVKIPKGILAGQRIRLAGQGGEGRGGGPHGDLYLEIIFRPHRLFRVETRDIHLVLPVTPWEAALGANIIVPTLGGDVELKIPPGSQSGHKLRLKGRGLPGRIAGDQYVELRIVTPSADTEAAKAFYQNMAEQLPMEARAGLRTK